MRTACLTGGSWPQEALRALTRAALSEDQAEAQEATRQLFVRVIEPLADLFEPRLCDVYVRLFSEIVAQAMEGVSAAELEARYQRIRHPRTCHGEPRVVYVLSRVTLGADIAVTSVLLDAARKRFRRAEIVLVGGEKAQRVFAGEPRIRPLLIPYGRTSLLRDRLAVWPRLRALLADAADAVVLDPDSRLTQLGLLPVAPEDRYFFFESRGYGAETSEPLSRLAARWCAEVLGVEDARPFIAPISGPAPAEVAISLGVGENPDKRMSESFEKALLQDLISQGRSILLDCGAGGEEAERARRVAAGLPQVRLFEGAFSDFAWAVARSRLYIGYDSSGQHAAAAAGAPLITVFKGYVSQRFFERWRPCGQGPVTVIPVSAGQREEEVLDRVLAAAR